MVSFDVDGQNVITADGNSTLTFQPGAHNLTVYAIDTMATSGGPKP